MARSMKLVARKFASFAEADRADDEHYASMSREERMEIFRELLATNRDYARNAATGFLRDFLELLNSHEVKYVIVGGWAVALHGHPRYTGDIDFFVECAPENAERLVRVLKSFNPGAFGFTAADLQEPNMCFQIGVEPQRIDLLTFAEGIDFESAWQSRQEILLEGVRAWMVSRELLIQNKVAAGRPQDLADADTLQRRGDHRATC